MLQQLSETSIKYISLLSTNVKCKFLAPKFYMYRQIKPLSLQIHPRSQYLRRPQHGLINDTLCELWADRSRVRSSPSRVAKYCRACIFNEGLNCSSVEWPLCKNVPWGSIFAFLIRIFINFAKTWIWQLRAFARGV